MTLSPDQVRQIATDAVSGRALDDPWFYLAVLCTTAVASALGSFISSYFKKRGEAFATKADFDELLEQLKQSTHLAEKIKADIQSRHGEAASVRALLRDRTESLVMATFDLELWLEQARSKAIEGQSFEVSASPLSKISALRDIYFPEILVEYRDFYHRHNVYVQWILSVQAARLQNQDNLEPVRALLARFEEIYQPFVPALATFRASVIAAARARGGL